MKGTLGITVAVVLHAAFLLFGGVFFMRDDPKHAKAPGVVVDLSAPEPAKEKVKAAAASAKESEAAAKIETEKPPDAEQIVRDLEKANSPQSLATRLEDVSLDAIEAALNGHGNGGGGDPSDVFTGATGGIIGGTARPGGPTAQKHVDETFTMGEIDQKPRCTLQTGPVYPSEMRGKKVEGAVTVIFVVDSSGRVTNQKVAKSSHPAFERPALDAVRRWKFEPAVKGGQSVACQMSITIRFDRS